jgi:hypothetical protein
MLSIESSLLLMTVLFNAGLAVFILRGNWKQPVNVLFGAFLVALALWGATLIAYGAAATSESAIAFGKMAYAVALLVGGSFYLFSLAFPENHWPATRGTLTVVGLTIAYCLALPLPRFLFAGLTILPQGNQVVLYPLAYLYFALLFCVLFLGGLARTWRKWQGSSEPSRNGGVRITVSDTGVGIPPAILQHLFQKFSRADAQRLNLLGSGLGLFLAKTFVEGMGGRTWANSNGPETGSRFIVELREA